MKFKRILLKLSGESLMGTKQYGIDPARLNEYVAEIKAVAATGVQIGIVIGGGNIYRGLSGAGAGMDRVQGDSMGMLATVINALALQATFEKNGLKTRVFSGIAISGMCDPMNAREAIKSLENGEIVIMAGGTGNPFFTTDTASVLRALEIKADVMMKGTRVDGIYTADPEKDKTAVKYDTITYAEAMEKKLEVMDMAAFALCSENKLPVVVFNMNTNGNLRKVLDGEKTGTIVHE
jgi:uridylate kinase